MLDPFTDPNNPHYWIDDRGRRYVGQPIVPPEDLVEHNTDGEICDACLERDDVEIVHPT